VGEKKSKSLQDLKAAEISGLKLGAYAVQNQLDGRRSTQVWADSARDPGVWRPGAGELAGL
jgi:hypothetical protein